MLKQLLQIYLNNLYVEKIITIITLILFVAGMVYADSETIFTKKIKTKQVKIISGTNPFKSQVFKINRDLTQLFFEDFESGAPGWYSVDETNPGAQWNTNEYNAYGGSGHSWWMGNPDLGTNGGYLDHWYQVLDSPEITLPGSGPLTLSFYQYRAIEEPEIYEDFDGWDGFNVRIRISGESYENAEILTNCDPAYNCESMYSFGFEHGEDPDGILGIPGWGGFTDGWIYTNISIPNQFIGEDIIISFAFASDPAYCTWDDPTLIGVFVDDMNVAGVFYNDGEDETGFTASSLVPVGGDLWHIYDDPTAPSPTHALGCFDSVTVTYNPNMNDYFISPEIELPSGLDIIWDMQIKDELDEPSSDLDCDYIIVQLRYLEGNQWSGWNSVSNPLGGQPQFVFTGNVNEWAPFSLCWPGYNDISVLAGYTIQFRIGLHSNADDPTTFGLCIDNFEVLSTLDVLAPSNLDAEHDLITGFVNLNWNAPSGLGGEMQWDDASFENAIHFQEPYTGYLGEDFPVGGSCTILEFTIFSHTLAGSTTLGVFEKSGATYSATPTYTMPIVTQPGTPATYPVSWDVQDDFIIAFECSSTIDCALDENTLPSEHSYILNEGTWISWIDMATAQALPDGEFGIRCTTTYPEVDLPNSYNVYRNLTSGEYPDDSLANVVDTSYIDDTVEPGYTYYYAVTAVYEEGESDYSNEDWVFVEIANAEELAYDDGTAETGYCAGAALNYLAVRITPNNYPVRLIRLKYFVTSIVSQLILRVWDDDGTGGLPGTQLLDPVLVVPTSDLIENDWSVITIPDIYDIIIDDGDFYIGWMEPSTSSLIGVDTNGPCLNRSYQYTGGIWFDHTAGIPQNLMMRAVVDTNLKLVSEFSADVTSGIAPLTVYFSDLSTQGIEPIVEWKWDFGEGNSSFVQNPSHTYLNVGKYTVTLTITDDNYSTDTETKINYITVYEAIIPISNFGANPTKGISPLTVTFIDSSDGDIDNWLWDFGDGSDTTYTTDIDTIYHIYNSVGLYTVNLTVSGSAGSDSFVYENYIIVYPNTDLIWPGDTNYDGTVDETDIIPIGIYFREKGPPRSSISFEWIGNDYPGNWSEQLASLADCNGNGEVDITDVLAICLNWDRTHDTEINIPVVPNNLDKYRENFVEIYNSLGENETEINIKNYIAELFNLPMINIINENYLGQNYPNPFAKTTEITFDLKKGFKSGMIKIYNVKGQFVKQYSIVPDRYMGQSLIVWNGKDENNKFVVNGIYLYKLEIDGKIVDTKRMLLLK